MKKLLYFLGIAFILPLCCVVLWEVVPFFQGSIVYLLLMAIQGASPTIAAFVVMNKCEENGSFGDKRIKEYFSLKYCALGFLIPMLVLFFSKCILMLLGMSNVFFSSISLKKMMIVLWALIAEEFGWRGFLQDWLEKRINKVIVPLIIGIIWTLWHYHFILAGTMEIPIFAFLISCILESYGYFWIVKKANGNIIPACIWHFSGNLFFNIFHIESYWICNFVYIVYVLLFAMDNKRYKNIENFQFVGS